MKKGLVVLIDSKYNSVSLYDSTQSGETIELRTSKFDATACFPGTLTATLINDGDDFNIRFFDARGEREKSITLDFCQAEALRVLLKLEDTSRMKFKYLEEAE